MVLRRPLALLLALLAMAPARAGGRSPSGAGKASAARAPGASRPPAKPAQRTASTASVSPALEKARTHLSALMKNPARRRYRHHWEKVIAELENAARGKDRGPALLDAARARYALYRFSAVERDRERALALADQAAKAGTTKGATFAAAIRREAGDDEPRPAPRRKGAPRATAVAGGTAPRAGGATPSTPAGSGAVPAPGAGGAGSLPGAPATDGAGEDTDPELDEEVADLSGPDAPGRGGAAAVAGSSDGARAQAAGTGGPAHVSEVRTWSNTDYTRVAIYLSRAVRFEKLEMPASGDQPRRLALDLRPALLDGQALRKPVGDALVERVRAAQRDPETVRVVLDLASRDGYQLFTLDDPPRLIVDVGTREAREDAVAQALRPGAPPPPATPSAPGGPPGGTLPADVGGPSHAGAAARGADGAVDEEGETGVRRPIRRIIVDAGHGGHDTGAIGPHGVREKDVTLAMAHRLARKLHDAGFEVVLTRRDDRYLRLEERTAIANVSHGDLFVSIHANAHPRRDRRGVETYFLNVTDDRYARRLAARENGLVLEDGETPLVQRIRSDLNAQTSAGASRRLAQMVQRELTGRVRRNHGEVRDLGVKNALFYVLLGARMPAILVETAFISNRDEERRLASPEYQQLVAEGVCRAVTDFAGGGSRVAAR